ncbi:beta-mannosidase [Paenibacillus sp. SYP-B4298]|uniref:beta-mannosidase n=1 Tax=Paenibacillus sp. SYP-B4298 TaxID=2996034 RepID=UPI0022DE7281|nr:glycoside hydrolase family 2 protein [Paenibacillus sp. SYP-B4298]
MRSSVVLDQWRFKACDQEGWLPAKVPGCVHTDLLRNEQIPAPFYGTNEQELQWIDKQDWEYETRFVAGDEWLSHSRLELVMEGLDTYAEVSLNGVCLLQTDNMFRTWRADVKRLLQSGSNHLHIRFRSPVKEDLPKLEQLGYSLPATNDQSEAGGLGNRKISVFARKAPYHYGWDWGPRFVTSGIWRPVRLEAWSGWRMRDVYIQQQKVTEQEAKLCAVVEIEAEQPEEVQLRLSGGGQVWEQTVSLAAGENTVRLEAVIAEPRLWWCRGLGEPALYTFTAELLAGGTVVAERSVRTGLRQVRLVKEKDTYGSTFYIELNGVPVFAKGANHIPNDSFLTEVTEERYRHEIASAVEANMNMLRVWGGGVYEDDRFYELCDEYGVLVWQDFMFACSMYPGGAAFQSNVREEAVQNVKRLRNHPSIVLWCGNNEIDIAWSQYDDERGWGWRRAYSPELQARIWADYEAIFHRILPEAVEQYAPGTDYWPSSPMVELTGDIHQHATNSTTGGDIHYWGVWHAVEPFANYNIHIGRFMSEYGFQSFPEYRSVRAYAEEGDMELESPVMLSHQKNGHGNRLIKEYMELYMKESKDFPSFLYMSQVLQAEAMKIAIEAHRRRKPYCMGTLYWQMNDCWPVASWASMDYYGRWKATQYAVKRSFEDILLSMDGTLGGMVGIHLVSDRLEPVSGTLQVRLLNFAGNVLKTWSAPAAIGGNTAGCTLTLSTGNILAELDPKEVVLMAELHTEEGIIARASHYFVPSKQLKLSRPSITVTRCELDGGIALLLETDVLAKHVWLSSEAEGIFSDNNFDLLPGQPATILFKARSDGNQPFLPADPGKVVVRSMADFVKEDTLS